MTNEALYQLMKDGFEQINQRFNETNQRLSEINQKLDRITAQLRIVEDGISELKGKRNAIAGMRSWIVTACAIKRRKKK